MGATSTDNFCLRWNDFAENVSGAFKELRAENDFFDVTLACSDSGARTLQAHKVILSACSNFFKTTFRQQMNAHKHPNPYIYLRGVSYSDLVSILDFIYNGEVNVAQEDLNSFLAVAEELQIKGLTNREGNNSSNNDTPGSGGNTTNSTSSASKKHKRPAMDSQTPVKKVRRSSPAPIASAAPTSELKEDKDMVNIKDDPEVIHGMASTSAVNPDEAAEYAGEDFDESYDGYYEDEGTELGESGEATDGTKAVERSSYTTTPQRMKQQRLSVSSGNGSPFRGSAGSGGGSVLHNNAMAAAANNDRYNHLVKIEGGKVRCTLCNSLYSCLVSARAHTIRVHEQPEYFECCFCKKIFRTKLNFRSHLNLSHGVKGSNLVASYGRLVDVAEFAAEDSNNVIDGSADEIIIDSL